MYTVAINITYIYAALDSLLKYYQPQITYLFATVSWATNSFKLSHNDSGLDDGRIK